MFRKAITWLIILLPFTLVSQETDVNAASEVWQLNHPSGSENWLNPNFVFGDDLFYANSSASIIALHADTTHYMITQGYDFNIPLGATILGVEVEIERAAGNLLALFNVKDETVSLVLDSTLIGVNKAKSTNWGLIFQLSNYGDATDLWGHGLTPEIINDSTFGVALSVQFNGLLAFIGSATLDAFVDHVAVQVSYSSPLPIVLKDFSATTSRKQTVLKWVTMSEINNDFFTIVKSCDGKNWNEVTRIKGAGNSNVEKHYSYVDIDANTSTTYYKLKQTDFDGQYEYSSPVMVEPNTESVNDFDVYYNVSDKEINITSVNGLKRVSIYNSFGSLVRRIDLESSDNLSSYKIANSNLNHFIIAEDVYGNLLKKQIKLIR